MQRAGGASLIRDRHELGDCNDPGSAAHHCVLRCARETVQLDILGAAASIAEIGVGEQLFERRDAADQALLVAIALHGLEVLAIGVVRP